MCVLIFFSRAYFNSKACLREAKAAVSESKPLIFVQEGDATYGGVTLEQLERECPDDLRQALFHEQSDSIIRWQRLPQFQDEVIVIIADRLLKLCMTGAWRGSKGLQNPQVLQVLQNSRLWRPGPQLLPAHGSDDGSTQPPRARKGSCSSGASLLYIPGSLSASTFLVGRTHLYVSAHNAGAKDVVGKLVQYFKAGSQATVVEQAPKLVHTPAAGVCTSRNLDIPAIGVPDRPSAEEPSARSKLGVHRISQRVLERQRGPETNNAQECLLLHLSEDVFCDANGVVNEQLCDELHGALEAQFRIILLHPIANVAFDHIIDTCPRNLIAAGLLRCIAIQLQPGPFEVVSAGLLAKMLNGKPHPRRWVDAVGSPRRNRASSDE
eukprot:6597382-Prymnesium_polylepis.1